MLGGDNITALKIFPLSLTKHGPCLINAFSCCHAVNVVPAVDLLKGIGTNDQAGTDLEAFN